MELMFIKGMRNKTSSVRSHQIGLPAYHEHRSLFKKQKRIEDDKKKLTNFENIKVLTL